MKIDKPINNANVSDEIASIDLYTFDKTPGNFIACQDEQVLGYFPDIESANERIKLEQQRDLFWLALKHKFLKLFFKGKADIPKTVYYIAEVKLIK